MIIRALAIVLVLTGWTHGSNVYEGNVATRAIVPTEVNVSFTQTMSRTGHYARDTVTSVKIAASNFVVGDTGPGASATIKASIEYPAGVCTQLKFSGAATGTIPNGQFLFSDYLPVNIPNGAQFWVRQFWQGSAGTIDIDVPGDTGGMGDALNQAASGISDQTISCDAVSNVVSTKSFFPVAIVARTTTPTVCSIGDSIDVGANDTYSGSSGDLGILARSIGPLYGYIKLSASGETAQVFVAGSTQRQLLLRYCSSGIVELGRNDLENGRTVAQLKADLATIYGYFPAARGVFQTTLIPSTTSTDNWATTANQTVTSWEGNRTSFNDQVRAGTFGPNSGMFNTDSVLETALNSGLWKAGAGFPACAPWTTTGIHPDACSYLQVQSSGVIDTSRIHYP